MSCLIDNTRLDPKTKVFREIGVGHWNLDFRYTRKVSAVDTLGSTC